LYRHLSFSAFTRHHIGPQRQDFLGIEYVSPHGGMLFLPLVTELTKRDCSSVENVFRSMAQSGLAMRLPRHDTQLRA
jgi:hypothetical protein